LARRVEDLPGGAETQAAAPAARPTRSSGIYAPAAWRSTRCCPRAPQRDVRRPGIRPSFIKA